MSGLASSAASVCAVLAVCCGVLVLVRTRELGQALPVLLDLLLAAGLLRLSADSGWRALATAAVVVAVRWLVAERGLRSPTTAHRRRPAPAGPA